MKAEWAAASFPSIITIRRFISDSVCLRGLPGNANDFVRLVAMIIPWFFL